MRRPRLPAGLILSAVVALGLAACARSGPPAPVVYGSGGPGQTQGETQSAPSQAGERRSGSQRASRPERQREADRSGRSSAPSQPRDRAGQPETVGQGDSSGRPTGQSGRQAQQTQRSATDVNWARTGRAGIHTVSRGDSVYGLARRYQVPIRAIIDANDLEPPYTLYVGQEIRIPVPRRHVVERGDTVYGISRAYGVDMSELTRLNDIQPPYEIAPGQVLVIPGRGQEAAPTRTARRTAGEAESTDGGPSAREQSRSTQRARATEAPSGTSEAADSPDSDGSGSDGSGGDGSGSDGSASRSTGTDGSGGRGAGDAGDAAALASLPSAPAGTPIPPRAPARKGETQTAERSKTQQRDAATQSTAAPRPKSIPQPPPRAESRFLWPVRGKVLSSFGPMDGGLHNDGINIAAPAGTPVKAAENGVVAYVGNELRGFGNLLLIKHADGWVTAYAHTQEILVRHGEQVKRGQIVARVGATGSVSEPQLHFEVRKGSTAKDPAQLLGSQQAAR